VGKEATDGTRTTYRLQSIKQTLLADTRSADVEEAHLEAGFGASGADVAVKPVHGGEAGDDEQRNACDGEESSEVSLVDDGGHGEGVCGG
jgi:hypothetical protein